MSEPTTLYKGKDELTVHAPSEVKRLLAEGWSTEKPEPSASKKASKGK